MVRLSRAIIASFLFVLLSLSVAESPRLSAGGDSRHVTSHLRIGNRADSEKGSKQSKTVLVTVESDKFRLTYPLAFAKDLPVDVLVDRVMKALARNELLFGSYEPGIEMFVAGRIVPSDPDFPEGLSIAGVTFVDDGGTIRVVVSLGSADVGTFAHELLHARLRQLGVEIPVWLEEGMAHFAESEDGFNEEMYAILKTDGALSNEEIVRIKGITKDEMRLRASGWAVVYYLVTLEGVPMRDVPDYCELPDPKEAFAAIERHLSKKAAFSRLPKSVVLCSK